MLMRGREGKWSETTQEDWIFISHVQYNTQNQFPDHHCLSAVTLQGGIRSNTAVINTGESLIWEELSSSGK